MSNATKTRWSDAEILDSVKRGHFLTPAAWDRAFELAELGMIDMSGTWRLTAKGEQVRTEGGF
jgi:hypothetical protein